MLDPGDSVYLVLWYRELAGKPLYSFDIRWGNDATVRNWGGGGRMILYAYIKLQSNTEKYEGRGALDTVH